MPALNLSQLAILIVDDTPANTALLEALLDDAGYDALAVINDAREVMAHVAMRPVDLILLDIRMPHLSGLEVLQQLRQHFAAQGTPEAMPPVIVLTAQTDAATREAALQLGARDFLTKPFNAWEVELRIRNQLEVRHYQNVERQRRADLEYTLQRREHELVEAHAEIIRRLAQAADYRDNETGMHVERMSRMSAYLAGLLGCDAALCEMIRLASPLHDLGKIGIPDHILLKPGRLSDEEMAVMRSHAQIGHRLLAGHPSPLMRLAADIALSHHEKWDGSGYPAGLAGDAIPLCGRICALADVFDALCSARPYKPAWPLEDALALIRRESGRHFDPTLTRLFLANVDAFVAIRERYHDQDSPPQGAAQALGV